MFFTMNRPMACFLTIIFLTALNPIVGFAGGKSNRSPSQKGGLQQRIDFGSTQILGQSIKSGAVYLMHRKKSDIKNMIEVRHHYRDEIKEDFDLRKTAIARGDSGLPGGNQLSEKK
jgi:hypothetical protein